jgi:hypothetical protein
MQFPSLVLLRQFARLQSPYDTETIEVRSLMNGCWSSILYPFMVDHRNFGQMKFFFAPVSERQ